MWGKYFYKLYLYFVSSFQKCKKNALKWTFERWYWSLDKTVNELNVKSCCIFKQVCTPRERIPQKDFSPKKQGNMVCFHSTSIFGVTSKLQVTCDLDPWLSSLCNHSCMVIGSTLHLHLVFYVPLNDYISSTSAAHLHLNLTHFCRKLWLRLNHYQERVLFFCLLSQQLLLIQQSLSVASELSRTETKCGVNERQAAGLRMRGKEGEKGTIAHHNMTWAEERDGKLQRLLSALFDAERAGKALWNQPINAFFMA